MKRFVSQMRIEASLERVWNFYTNLDMLIRITLPRMNLQVVRADLPLRQGARVAFRIGTGLFHIQWETLIREFVPMERFVDEQTKGPFSSWVHRHEFFPDSNGVVVCDTLDVGMPHGLFGRLAETMLIDHEIHELFRYREEMTKRLLEDEKTIGDRG